MSIADIGQILASTKQIGGDPIETAVAKAYLAKHVDDFDGVQFNVGLGPGVTLPYGTPDYVQKCASASGRLRADMICYAGNTATIVEVKDRIYAAVMGQLLAYWHLLKDDNPQLLQVYKVAAGQSIIVGLEPVLENYGISVELFPGVWVPPYVNPST
jgi:hypothetical protein